MSTIIKAHDMTITDLTTGQSYQVQPIDFNFKIDVAPLGSEWRDKVVTAGEMKIQLEIPGSGVERMCRWVLRAYTKNRRGRRLKHADWLFLQGINKK